MGISFLYPNMLWGLFLVLIPILIHLFNFQRHTTVYFSNVKTLQQLQEKTKSQRQVKNWLILLLRCLTIAALVTAFAFPFSAQNKLNQEEIICLYIDNSMSMKAEGQEGELLKESKRWADQVINKYGSKHKFCVFSNDNKTSNFVPVSFDKAKDLVAQIQYSPTPNNFSKINKLSEQIEKEEHTVLKRFWFSDFQGFQDSTIFNDQTEFNFLCKLAPNKNKNIYIDSVWFESPDRNLEGTENISYRVINGSEEAIEQLPVKLILQGKEAQINNINIDGNDQSTGTLNFDIPSDSLIKGSIVIEDAAIDYDNKFHFAYKLKKEHSILIISDSDDFILSISKIYNHPSIKLKTTSSTTVNYDQLAGYDLIILGELKRISTGLSNELNRLISADKSVAIFPNKKGNLNDYNYFGNLTKSFAITGSDTNQIPLEEINPKEPFFKGVFKDQTNSGIKINMPKIYHHFQIKNLGFNNKKVIALKNGEAFLNQTKNLYFFTSGVTEQHSSLLKNSLIVPIFYRLYLSSIQSKELFHQLGSNAPIKLQKNVPNIVELNYENLTQKIALENNTGAKHLPLPSTIKKDGFITLINSGKPLNIIALNYDRLESKTEVLPEEKLRKLIINSKQTRLLTSLSQIEDSVTEIEEGKSYWKWLIIMALGLLLVESIVIRFFKS